MRADGTLSREVELRSKSRGSKRPPETSEAALCLALHCAYGEQPLIRQTWLFPPTQPGRPLEVPPPPAVWAQAARVEAMRATRRAAVAEADGEATDDEAEAAAEEDELPLGCI